MAVIFSRGLVLVLGGLVGNIGRMVLHGDVLRTSSVSDSWPPWLSASLSPSSPAASVMCTVFFCQRPRLLPLLHVAPAAAGVGAIFAEGPLL